MRLLGNTVSRRGLFQANVELADEGGLKPILSFIVERTASILQKRPIIEPKIVSLLGTRPWLALELLRRGQHLTRSSNPITVVMTTEEESDSDWSFVRDEVVKLLLCCGGDCVGNCQHRCREGSEDIA